MGPDVESFIVPAEDAVKSFLERPVSSVIMEYEFVVLHVLRKLPKRHQTIPFLLVTPTATLLLRRRRRLLNLGIIASANQIHLLSLGNKNCFLAATIHLQFPDLWKMRLKIEEIEIEIEIEMMNGRSGMMI